MCSFILFHSSFKSRTKHKLKTDLWLAKRADCTSFRYLQLSDAWRRDERIALCQAGEREREREREPLIMSLLVPAGQCALYRLLPSPSTEFIGPSDTDEVPIYSGQFIS